jgi:hypothetical protein
VDKQLKLAENYLNTIGTSFDALDLAEEVVSRLLTELEIPFHNLELQKLLMKLLL